MLPECYFAKSVGSISLTLKNVIIKGSAAIPDPLLRLSTSLYFLRVENCILVNANSPSTRTYLPNWTGLWNRYPLLETLVSYTSGFTGTLPTELPPSMIAMFLTNNTMTGTISPTLLSKTKAVLFNLNLAGNKLTGTLPPALLMPLNTNVLLARITLDVSRNQLSGTIAPNFFNLNTTIMYSASLYFANNRFTGTLSTSFFPPTLFNGDSFVADFSNNQLTGDVPALTAAYPNSRLTSLWVSFKSNALDGTIPDIWVNLLGASGYLETVTIDYSDNRISGPLLSLAPISSYSKLTTLSLNLASNALTGTLPSLTFGSISLTSCIANVSNNQLSGPIPAIGAYPSKPKTASLSLSLANNRLEGPLPTTFFQVNTIVNNVEVDISSNKLAQPLTAAFFQSIPALAVRTIVLNMANCSFFGPLPDFKSSTGIMKLNLSKNAFNGTLPSDMLPGATNYLVDLSDNFLEGTIFIPDTSPRMISLWLARNLFTNLTITPGVNLIQYFDVSGNTNLTGELPSSMFEASTLSTLNISRTAITGLFPNTSTFYTRGLVSLDLSHTSIDYCALNGEQTNKSWIAASVQRCDVTGTNALDCLSSYPLVCDPSYKPPVAPISPNAPGAVPSSQTQTPSTSSPDEPTSSASLLAANLSLLLLLLLVLM